MFRKWLPAWGLLLSTTGCVTSENADTFTATGLLSGAVTTEAYCQQHDSDTALWLMVDGEGECIRYFHHGLTGQQHELLHIWLDGDRLAGKPGNLRALNYGNQSPARQKWRARRVYEETDLPSIVLSRPGTHGSSGFHTQRRRPRNVAIVRAAVTALSKKYGAEELVISGQSGGGHLVGALLAERDDIQCAVASSASLAVAKRIAHFGWSADATGYNDFYDPIAHVADIPEDTGRRIFIIGDPRDLNVPFSSQRAYYEEVKKAGHAIWLISTKTGRGQEYHRLAHVALDAIFYCSKNMPATEIVRRLAK